MRAVASIGIGWVIQKMAIITVTAAARRASTGKTAGSIGAISRIRKAAMPSINP